MSEGHDFWSRRKAQVAAEVEAEEAAAEARRVEATQNSKTDAEILAELELPDPETLGSGDDFSGFMAKAVPAHLRRLALRRLWLTNPVLANVDGLVDYGEDFTDAACVIEKFQTTYQVGKGMKAHVEELARQADLDIAVEDAEAEAADSDDDTPAADTTPITTEEPAVATTDIQSPESEEEFVTVPRRRMRFQFDAQNMEGATT